MIWQNSHLRFTDALTFIFFYSRKNYLFLLFSCSSIACIHPALSPGGVQIRPMLFPEYDTRNVHQPFPENFHFRN